MPGPAVAPGLAVPAGLGDASTVAPVVASGVDVVNGVAVGPGDAVGPGLASGACDSRGYRPVPSQERTQSETMIDMIALGYLAGFLRIMLLAMGIRSTILSRENPDDRRSAKNRPIDRP
jgi:hypothetical protein